MDFNDNEFSELIERFNAEHPELQDWESALAEINNITEPEPVTQPPNHQPPVVPSLPSRWVQFDNGEGAYIYDDRRPIPDFVDPRDLTLNQDVLICPTDNTQGPIVHEEYVSQSPQAAAPPFAPQSELREVNPAPGPANPSRGRRALPDTREIPCPYKCGKKFFTPGYANRHARTCEKGPADRHTVPVDPNRGRRGLPDTRETPCPYDCGKLFFTAGYATHHAKTCEKGPTERTIPCPVNADRGCVEKFFWEFRAEEHGKACKDRFPCPKNTEGPGGCTVWFTKEIDAIKHAKRCNGKANKSRPAPKSRRERKRLWRENLIRKLNKVRGIGSPD
ncbi:hypothetical protein IWX49DRAFT_589189 [Phyllosticta citricarpa]|uniref:C2H2-type domain-containing protein n=2 Tax=Phyllosticta TaxID=121621 RepID=A0ABR1MAH0_9PEZI